MSQLGILESIADPAFVADVEGRLIETNRAFSEIFGSSANGQSVSEAWPETADFWEPALAASASGNQLRADISAHAEDGRELEFDVRISVVDDAASARRVVVGVARDVTAERNRARQLEVQATTDALTGAYNRRQLEVLLAQAIRIARRQKTTGAFIFMDVDGFKAINDSFGHEEGDRVLKQVTTVLHDNLRESDVVARIGGDEFGVVLAGSDAPSASVKAERLAVALNGIGVGGLEEGIYVSIGLAVFPVKGEQAKDVIKHADAAMYRAKRTPGRKAEAWKSE